jgi:hypothetical protein
MTNYYKRLRAQLPRNYAVQISNRIPETNPRQVRAVFGGLVTRKEIVDPIIKVALKIRDEEQKRETRLKSSIKSKRINHKRAA